MVSFDCKKTPCEGLVGIQSPQVKDHVSSHPIEPLVLTAAQLFKSRPTAYGYALVGVGEHRPRWAWPQGLSLRYRWRRFADT
jgi:hypothetical protein